MKARKVVAGSLSALVVMTPATGQYRSPWPQIREFGGAIPKNERDWVGVDDYPAKALRDDVQGNVVVTFDIGTDGRARNCVIDTSSGSAVLDQVPCPLIVRKAKFKPASTEDGISRDAKARYSVAFWLPS